MAATPPPAPPLPTIDFTAGALAHRLRSGAGRGGMLARAVGSISSIGGPAPLVVDATAGLGRDAFVLASLGMSITLIERAPRVHAALAAALAQAITTGGHAGAAAARMTLLHGDARLLMAGLHPAIVLVDPMHPEPGRRALVKLPMRQLRAVVGEDADSGALINAALAAATHRVVLKWPRLAPALPGLRAPSHTLTGRTTRYDVFVLG